MELEKGRNSTRVGIRLNNEDILILQEIAKTRGMSFNGYLAERLHVLVEKYRSVPAINGEATGTANRSVPAKKPYDPNVHNLTNQLPIYNPAIHKVGDKVRVWKFGRWKAVVIPELNSEREPIDGGINGGINE